MRRARLSGRLRSSQQAARDAQPQARNGVVRTAVDLADRVAITDIFLRYIAIMDSPHSTLEEFRALFSEEPVLESDIAGSHSGRGAVNSFWTAARSATEGQRIRHYVSNLAVSGDGRDTAELSAYFCERQCSVDGDHAVELRWIYGTYRCEFVRTRDDWQMTRRCVAIDRP